MPLSDREQQILADIEARLRAEDPRLAKNVSTTTVSSDARRQIKVAIIGFVIGFLMLFAGVLVHPAWGIGAFLLMLASAVHGGNMIKRLGSGDNPGLGGQLQGGVRRYLDAHRRDDDPTA
ncbi:MAG: DUF3040 domain-containing protein [Egibacteraceae bacterium]